jgi:hypothetical protein
MVPHHFACRTGLVIPHNPRLAAGVAATWPSRAGVDCARRGWLGA